MAYFLTADPCGRLFSLTDAAGRCRAESTEVHRSPPPMARLGRTGLLPRPVEELPLASFWWEPAAQAGNVTVGRLALGYASGYRALALP